MAVQATGLKQWLIRVTTGNFLMRVASTALGFCSTLLLARLLPAEQFGGYVYAMAWVNLLVIPAVLGFDKLVIRNVSIFEAEQHWAHLRGMWRFSLWFTGGLGVGIALLTYLFGGVATRWLDAVLVEPLRLAVVLIPLIAVARVRGAVMIGLHHVVPGKFPEMVLRPLLFILFLLLFHQVVQWPMDARTAVALNLVAVVIAFVVGGILLRRVMPVEAERTSPVFNAGRWLRAAAPLALLAALQIINSRIDIIMLGALRGAVDVAIYNVVTLAATLTSFVLVAATGAISPVVAQTYAQGKAQRLQHLVTSSSRAIFAASLPIALLMLIFGQPFLALFGAQYEAGYPALAVLVVGQLLNAAFGAVGVLLTMTHHGGLAARGAAIGMLANVMLNMVLIPLWGVVGAAVASMLTLLLWNLLFALFVRRELGIRPTVVG